MSAFLLLSSWPFWLEEIDKVPSVFVNKVLLKHQHIHLFTWCPQHLLLHSGRGEWFQQSFVETVPKADRIYSLALYRKFYHFQVEI
jgi:hypothetical protein